jgi:hypothetical protein
MNKENYIVNIYFVLNINLIENESYSGGSKIFMNEDDFGQKTWFEHRSR